MRIQEAYKAGAAQAYTKIAEGSRYEKGTSAIANSFKSNSGFGGFMDKAKGFINRAIGDKTARQAYSESIGGRKVSNPSTATNTQAAN